MRRPRAGLSLVETLIAVGIVVVVFGLLAANLGSARRAHRTVDDVSETAATLRLASELLREQLLLAGSAPWPVPSSVTGVPAGLTPAQFVNQGLRVSQVGAGHSLRLVYVDDRLTGGVVARDLTFEAGLDGQGQPQLYRRAGSGARQPWVAGVELLVVEGAIGEGGVELGLGAFAGVPVRALRLRLEAQGASERVVLELPHRPVVVGP